MNNIKVIFLLLLITAIPAQADQLGRLFTTPAQRTMLEDLRNSRPGLPEHIVRQYEEVTIRDQAAIAAKQQQEEELLVEEIEVEEIPVLEEPISLKGVVSRKKGNHTAWINENNTYEGGLIEEDISVRTRDIKKDTVKVKLPDKVTNVTLKVGETYIPEALPEEE